MTQKKGTYKQSLAVEEQGRKVIIPFLTKIAYGGRFVWTDSDKFLQNNYGDILVSIDSTETVAVEMKTEKENKYGNLFLETWSNKRWNTPGWMDKLESCDILLYNFLKSDECFGVHFPSLVKWFNENKTKYKEKPQNKYVQANDTWGRPVPISVLTTKAGVFNMPFTDPDEWVAAWYKLVEISLEFREEKTITSFNNIHNMSCTNIMDSKVKL
jgi:hypothetical protein